MLPPGPVEPLPRRAFVLTARDVPGDHADEGRVRLRRRLGPARAEPQPREQPEPARENADEQYPGNSEDAPQPPLAAGRRRGTGLAPNAQDEPRQDGANPCEGPPDVT